MSAPERIWAASVTENYGEWQTTTDGMPRPTEYVRADLYAALEAQNNLWQQNMREAYEAFTAMRNDLNELFPMQSAEADLLEGPEWSVACAAIVDAARDRFAALEAQLAERVKARSEPVQVYIDHADHTITTTLKDAIEDMKGFLAQGWDLQTEAHFMLALSALEATPPAPKVTECATEGCEQTATVRFERGGVGSDYCHDCYMRIQTFTAAQEAGKP